MNLINSIDEFIDSLNSSSHSLFSKNENSLSPEKGIKVYQINIVEAKKSVLKEIYSVTKSLLGEECFEELAQKFSIATPSTNADLNLYGEQFYLFVKKAPFFDRIPYLSDLAKVEWNYHYYAQSFDAKSSGPDKEDLLKKKGSDANFRALSDLTLIESKFPVFTIFAKVKSKDFSFLSEIELSNRETLIIFNDRETTNVKSLDHYQLELLNQLTDFTSLENLTSKLNINRQEEMPRLLTVLINETWIEGK